MTKLTVSAAKDYAAMDQCSHKIEGAGMTSVDGVPVCRLNVTGRDHGAFFDVVWDVFEENDGMGGVCLRGEF